MESYATAPRLNSALPSFEVVMGLTLNFSTTSNPIHPFHKMSLYSKIKMKVSSSDIFIAALLLFPWIQVGPALHRRKQLLWCSQTIHHQICLGELDLIPTKMKTPWSSAVTEPGPNVYVWSCPRNKVTAATSLDEWILISVLREATTDSNMPLNSYNSCIIIFDRWHFSAESPVLWSL